MRALLPALLTAAAWSGGPAAAQTLHLAVAADRAAVGPPALVTLRRSCLQQLAAWPRGLDPLAAFTLHWDHEQLRIVAGGDPGPATAYAGEFTLPGDVEVLLRARDDGSEDWWVQGGTLPPRLRQLATLLDLQPEHGPRRLDVAAAGGNLATALLDQDPRLGLLPVAADCGELLVSSWRTPTGLRVRGRSGGGLLLPALVIALWSLDDPADAAGRWRELAADDVRRWSVRGFASRDAGRAEAARQLARSTAPAATATLQALLHADDLTAAAAIDSLLRLERREALPAIAAAAGDDRPHAAAMAATAQAELLPPPAGSRWLLPLFALTAGLAGLWWRERCRLRRDAG